MKSIAKMIGYAMFAIYALGALVLTPYNNYMFAKTHGFLSWIFFGEIIATLQALFWPAWFFF